MPKSELSDSESRESESSGGESESNEHGTPENGKKLSEYEKQRLKRIEENKRRMEALGLKKMANSFMGSVRKVVRNKSEKKGKRKLVDEDEEYKPTEEEDDDEEISSSSEGGEEISGSRKNKPKKKTTTPKKQVPSGKPSDNSDFVDDDDALMQAIALSLHDSAGSLNVVKNAPTKNPGTHATSQNIDESKVNAQIHADAGKKRRKKLQIPSQFQMTDDEVAVHFFQLDGTQKGGITLRDIRRVAAEHDFTWSDKEMADMIHCFDSDGDGKLSLDDFHEIVERCNMLKDSA